MDEALSDGSTALILAAKRGSLPVVKLLLECKGNVNKLNAKGQSALSVCPKRGGVAMCELLFSAGADHRIGDNPVFSAVKDERLDVCELLLKRGYDASRKVDNVASLFLATKKKLQPFVELLIAHGADLTATNGPHGQTALQLARTLNEPELAALLTPRLA